MLRIAGYILIALAALLQTAQQTTAKDRVALVIGNSDYLHALAVPHARNDASAIKDELEKLGFRVLSGENLNKTEMKKIIEEFSYEIDGETTALFYFAGHSINISRDNFLLPVDADLGSFNTARDSSVSSYYFYSKPMHAKNSIFIFDACYENPSAHNLARQAKARGYCFQPEESGHGSLISLSSSPGEILSATQSGNSAFATAIIRNIGRQEPIAAILERVGAEVASETNGAQAPWTRSWLVDEPNLTIRASGNVPSRKDALCEDGSCTPVRVFFGTNRILSFSPDGLDIGAGRGTKISLGSTIVTIPKAGNRKRGEINLPSWWQRNFLWGNAQGDPARYFTIPKNSFILFKNSEDFIGAAKHNRDAAGTYRDHVFVFVHGYNTSFEAGLFRTAQIAYDLGYQDNENNHIPFGTAFLFSWPSAAEVSGYIYDQDSSRLATDHLKEFIRLVANRSGAKYLHIIAHSMGNIPLLSALNEISKETKAGVKIAQVILAAPDLDVEEFEKLAEAVTSLAKGVTLYASSNDLAIRVSRKIRKDAPRAGDVPADGPVVMKGIYSIDISKIDTGALAVSHSYYAEDKVLLNDISHILSKGEQPPHTRNVNYSRKRKGRFDYWLYAD